MFQQKGGIVLIIYCCCLLLRCLHGLVFHICPQFCPSHLFTHAWGESWIPMLLFYFLKDDSFKNLDTQFDLESICLNPES